MKNPPAVNASLLPGTGNAYVAWLDVMGVQSIMSRSLPVSANFILKFHALALRHRKPTVELFPVMDGLYVASASQEETKQFLREVFTSLAELFVGEKENKHRFLVRAGLAYGPVVLGKDVTAAACPEVNANAEYARTLLLGIPMIQAHLDERSAPPFGCQTNDSARAFSPSGSGPFNEFWWRWYLPTQHTLSRKLAAALEMYFEWCAERSGAIGYDASRIAAHRAAAKQYFSP